MNSIGLNDMDLFGMPTGGGSGSHNDSKTNDRGENLKSPPPLSPPSCLTRFDTHADPAACCFSAGPKAVVPLA